MTTKLTQIYLFMKNKNFVKLDGSEIVVFGGILLHNETFSFGAPLHRRGHFFLYLQELDISFCSVEIHPIL